MAVSRFRDRGEVRVAYPLASLFDDLIVYVQNSTLEGAKSVTVTKLELENFVVSAKRYALGTPRGTSDRYDVFSILFKEIDKCTNGKPQNGVSSAINTWALDEREVLYMFSSYYGGS